MTLESGNYSNEPIKSKIKNGMVLPQHETSEYGSEEERLEAIEKLVDGEGESYYEARLQLGIVEKPHANPNIDLNPGVSVELGERAAAVTQLMDGISAQNSAAGSLSAIKNNPKFRDRYDNPDKVVRGLEKKSAQFERAEDEAIETLAKTAALRALGFTGQDLAVSRDSIVKKLTGLRPSGRIFSDRRKKQKMITENTAHTVNKNEQDIPEQI